MTDITWYTGDISQGGLTSANHLGLGLVWMFQETQLSQGDQLVVDVDTFRYHVSLYRRGLKVRLAWLIF